MPVDKYYEEFKALVTVVETYGGTFLEPDVLEKQLLDTGVLADMTNNLSIIENSNQGETKATTKITQEKILALMLLKGANWHQFSEVCNSLYNQFTQGVDTYPKTIENTARLLNNSKTTMVKQTQQYEEEEVAFMDHAEQRCGSSGEGTAAKAKRAKAKAKKEKD